LKKLSRHERLIRLIGDVTSSDGTHMENSIYYMYYDTDCIGELPSITKDSQYNSAIREIVKPTIVA
jgi:hypothetical protein